ncbi:MAG: DEAD/DEAH box helicase, partial [archaeon]
MFNIPELVLKANNFKEFNSVQVKALKNELYKENLVVSSPTSSGKTIVAELSILESVLTNKRKAVYCCPLRALASEHFNDLKKKYSKELGIKMTVSTGDFDSKSKYLSSYDLIFSTYEKVESLIRHEAEWLKGIGLLVVDEIHEIDSSRGATLEILITKLRLINPKLKILALSATIPNSKDLADWLEAKLVSSDFRPVKLVEGVFFNNQLKFNHGLEKISLIKDELTSVVSDTLLKGKQALVFCNSRRNAESYAVKLSSLTRKFLKESDSMVLKKSSEKIKNVLEQPTEQCLKLANLSADGVGFHHAGLLSEQRHSLEGLFKLSHLKVLTSTPTLAAGVNLPAHTVIIPSLYRYSFNGMQEISVREYKQLAGRAGRPKYDSNGRAVTLGKSEMDADRIFSHYINGVIEETFSQLSLEPVLRTHLLSVIANNFVFDLKSLEDFFSKTLYFHQYGNLEALRDK